MLCGDHSSELTFCNAEPCRYCRDVYPISAWQRQAGEVWSGEDPDCKSESHNCLPDRYSLPFVSDNYSFPLEVRQLILKRITNEAELLNQRFRTQDQLPILWQDWGNNKDSASRHAEQVAIQVENEAESLVEDEEDDNGSEYEP